MNRLFLKIQSWLSREEGQDLVEYALIIALLSVVLVASLKAVETNLSTVFSKISSDLA